MANEQKPPEGTRICAKHAWYNTQQQRPVCYPVAAQAGCPQCSAKDLEIARLKEYLERAGWRRCDIAACNCYGYHDHSDHVAALAEAERAQLERDCAAVCGNCQWQSNRAGRDACGWWQHYAIGLCLAALIREADYQRREREKGAGNANQI